MHFISSDSYVLVMFAEDETSSIIARDKVVEEGTLTVHDQCIVKCGRKEFIGEVLLCGEYY